jgi:hypothetical protein
MTHELVAVLFAAALTPVPASAQTPTRAQLQPYLFVAPGGIPGGTTTVHGGGGFEVVMPIGLGGGVELGYVGPFPDGFDYGIGLVSVNGSYRIRGWGSSRAVPFVTAGYSTSVFRASGARLANGGAGLEYWMREGLGLRFELRDHFRPDGKGHLWGLRDGFTWAP